MLVKTSLNFTAIVRLIKGHIAYLNIVIYIPLGEKPFECLYIATNKSQSVYVYDPLHYSLEIELSEVQVCVCSLLQL